MSDASLREPSPRSTPLWHAGAVLLVALALSIGWGVRGNWGHEYGAMIPGALAAVAACLVSGRTDWWRRVAYFAFFGALGWSFGGSISYMQVIAYTHSGHFASVIYGFACLFLIGFLWGALGGIGTALPAVLDRDRLTGFFVPVLAVLGAWVAEDAFYSLAGHYGALVRDGRGADAAWLVARAGELAEYLAQRPAAQFDTDWLAALLALAAVGALAVVRGRICHASSLIMHLALGWWLGFALLVLALGLRMTPPRGDSWAGALGMTIGAFVYLWRQKMFEVAFSGLVVGWFAGLGFSGATLIKLVAIKSDLDTNWHSVLEQTFGFIAGLGVAAALGYLSTRTTPQTDDPPQRRWTELVAVAFTMLVVTWVNISKNVSAVWLPNKILPAEMYGLAAFDWFALAYLVLSLAFLVLLFVHYRTGRIALVPPDWLGKGQLLFLVFLWWIVIGNLSRVVPFDPQRLITEGVIHANACLCTLLVLLLPSRDRLAPHFALPCFRSLNQRLALAGLAAAVILILTETGITRAVWGDQYTGKYAGLHIRFGERATLDNP